MSARGYPPKQPSDVLDDVLEVVLVKVLLVVVVDVLVVVLVEVLLVVVDDVVEVVLVDLLVVVVVDVVVTVMLDADVLVLDVVLLVELEDVLLVVDVDVVVELVVEVEDDVLLEDEVVVDVEVDELELVVVLELELDEVEVVVLEDMDVLEDVELEVDVVVDVVTVVHPTPRHASLFTSWFHVGTRPGMHSSNATLHDMRTHAGFMAQRRAGGVTTACLVYHWLRTCGLMQHRTPALARGVVPVAAGMHRGRAPLPPSAAMKPSSLPARQGVDDQTRLPSMLHPLPRATSCRNSACVHSRAPELRAQVSAAMACVRSLWHCVLVPLASTDGRARVGASKLRRGPALHTATHGAAAWHSKPSAASFARVGLLSVTVPKHSAAARRVQPFAHVVGACSGTSKSSPSE